MVKGALRDDDVHCLSVCLSVCRPLRTCEACTETAKPINGKNYSIITSSQIQDGERLLIRKSLCRHISQWKMIWLWWHLVHKSTMKTISPKFKFLHSRWRTDAIFEIIIVGHNATVDCLIFAKFCTTMQNPRTMIVEFANFENPKWRTAILKIYISVKFNPI